VSEVAGESVLVVEDTELLRRIYTDKLAQECLNIVRTQPLDLILLDLVMPRMSGLEALEALKRDPRMKDVPVVILSNLGQDSDIQRGLDLGAVDYLIKNSAKPADVSAKIRATLDSRGECTTESTAFKVVLKDREADVEDLICHAKLTKRLACPACEVELTLELLVQPARPGWYDAHFICPSCGREF
jgi:CheY-like chemotaxis protein